MPEAIKQKILDFLAKTPEKRFNVKQLYLALKDDGNNISYGTLLKWIDILKAEKEINLEDYGNIKLVWCK